MHDQAGGSITSVLHDVAILTVEDLLRRPIVGWAMRSHMGQELVPEALEMAIQRRKPGPGVIHRFDRGS